MRRVRRRLQQAVDACAVEDLPATPRNTEMEQKIGGRLMTCKTSEFTSVVSISVTQMLYRKPGKINAMRFEFTQKGARFYWREKDYENTVEVGMDGANGVSAMVLGDLHYTAYSKGGLAAGRQFEAVDPPDRDCPMSGVLPSTLTRTALCR